MLALALGLALIAVGAPEAWHRMSGKPWDGQQEWWLARFFFEGADPYSTQGIARINLGYIGHPPTSAFYALPFALFDLKYLGRLLGCVEIALLALQLVLLAREVKLPWQSAVLTLGLLFHVPFFLYHLGVAQVSMLIGVSYFFIWYFLRRGRDVPAGIALGFACTLKLFPGALGILFLALRRWRAAAAAIVFYLAVAALVTARFGLASWREYFANEENVVNLWIGHASNVTLQGIILRLFHPVCVGDSFSYPPATRIAVALALVLLFLIIMLSRRRWQTLDLPFSLLVIWSMLANAFYWEHYDVILITPLALIARHLYDAPLPRRWKLAGAATLAAAVACSTIAVNSARVLLAWSRGNPAFHLRAHLTEIGTALPMPLLFIVAALLLRRVSRNEPA
jgi:Glycosyltransferase family 87